MELNDNASQADVQLAAWSDEVRHLLGFVNRQEWDQDTLSF